MADLCVGLIEWWYDVEHVLLGPFRRTSAWYVRRQPDSGGRTEYLTDAGDWSQNLRDGRPFWTENAATVAMHGACP